MRSQDELNAVFRKAREDREALLAELEGLTSEEIRARLAGEPTLVRACVFRWRSLRGNPFSTVCENKADQKILDRQIAKICNAAGEAAKRYYGYADAKPLQTTERWREAVSDLLDVLCDVPLTVVTHEFERALSAYR